MRLLQKYGEILELDEKRGYAIRKTYPQEMKSIQNYKTIL